MVGEGTILCHIQESVLRYAGGGRRRVRVMGRVSAAGEAVGGWQGPLSAKEREERGGQAGDRTVGTVGA